MTKAELIERIVDTFDDMSGECLSDYLGMDSLSLEEATTYLAERRALERDCDLAPDECLPDDVTPALYMEAENCYIRMMQCKARAEKIANYLEEVPDLLVYSYSYMYDCHPTSAPNDICPMDFFTEALNDGEFYFDRNDRTYTREEILKAFSNSLTSIDMDDDYVCFYDYGSSFKIITTSEPTDAIDVDDFATCIVENPEAMEFFINEVIEEDDLIEKIFHCTKDEVMKGVVING